MQIIGLCGLKGSGKDTVGKILEQEKEFYNISFADAVKDVVCAVFDYDRNMIDGLTEDSRQWREQIDTWWSHELNIPDFTPRKALTLIGTDVFRKYISDEIWIKIVHRKVSKLLDQNKNNCITDVRFKNGCNFDKNISQQSKNICITDIRFKNEFNFVKNILGGDVYQVKRNIPLWYDVGIKASNGCQESILYLEKNNIHKSEWDWLSEIPNLNGVIENTSSFSELTKKVENILLHF